jgi:hypothetical protein
LPEAERAGEPEEALVAAAAPALREMEALPEVLTLEGCLVAMAAPPLEEGVTLARDFWEAGIEACSCCHL